MSMFVKGLFKSLKFVGPNSNFKIQFKFLTERFKCSYFKNYNVLNKKKNTHITNQIKISKRRYTQYYFQNINSKSRIPDYFNNEIQNKETKSFFNKKKSITYIFVIIFSGIFFFFSVQSKNTFPKSVTVILKKAIIAESHQGGYDNELALKYYIQALNQCNQLKMDNLSDEYVGIQLKIAQLFEKLNMIQDASSIYNEILILYLSVLTASPGSKNYKRIKNTSHRKSLIQKDLRIAIKLVELNKNNLFLSKSILITHLIIAQNELNKNFVFTKVDDIKSVNFANHFDNKFNVNQYNNTDHDIVVLEPNNISMRLLTPHECAESFLNDFFNAMDLLSAIFIATGELNMASKVKISLTESILISSADPFKFFFNQCNMGSLLLIQAEEFEFQETILKKAFCKIFDLNINDINVDNLITEKLEDPSFENNHKDLIKEKESYKAFQYNKNRCFTLAIKSYESVLNFVRNSQQKFVHNSNIDEVVALATYGLGIINFHLSNFQQAEKYLRESRVKSKNCNYNELIYEIEKELNLLLKKKKSNEDKDFNKENFPIRIDIHLKKK